MRFQEYYTNPLQEQSFSPSPQPVRAAMADGAQDGGGVPSSATDIRFLSEMSKLSTSQGGAAGQRAATLGTGAGSRHQDQ